MKEAASEGRTVQMKVRLRQWLEVVWLPHLLCSSLCCFKTADEFGVCSVVCYALSLVFMGFRMVVKPS